MNPSTTNEPRRRIALTGFSGTGKSTVGPLLARRLGWRFVDTDQMVNERTAMDTAAIFAQRGEAHFRELEREACLQACALPCVVIATGGGALLRADTRRDVERECAVVCLHTGLAEVERRLAASEARPLVRDDPAALRDLFDARSAHYGSFALRVDADGRTPAAVVDAIVRLLTKRGLLAGG